MVDIIIADDDFVCVANIFKNIIKGNRKLRIIDITQDGISTYNTILKYKPEIIILDLNLPKLDGIAILEKLRTKKINTNILVVSGDSYYLSKLQKYQNVVYVFQKPFSFEKLLKLVNKIADQIEYEKFETKIHNMFKELNFNTNAFGTKYLKTAILYTLYDNSLLKNMENNLYNSVAIYYKTTNKRVKWNINRSIKSMWRYTNDRNKVSLLFGKDSLTCPSAKDIIESFLDILK